MTLQEFAMRLDSLGYDVARDEFPTDYNATCPYLIYEVGGSNNFVADNKVYHKIRKITVSIYTKGKSDAIAEEKLEALFDELEIPWEYEGSYDHEQYDYETIYSIQL